MRIQPYTETIIAEEDMSWLLSDHGVDEAFSITLDSVSCAALYPAPSGSPLVFVPSGTLLAKITSGGQSGKYGPYDVTTPATDGRQLATGLVLLAHSVQLSTYTGIGGLVDSPAAALWHGGVITSKLPRTSGIGAPDSAAKAALTTIYWH